MNLYHDPFKATGEIYVERQMLRAAMRDKETVSDPLLWEKSARIWERGDQRHEPIGGTRDVNFLKARVKGFQQRLNVAAIGGIFLIAPMWLMVLHNTLYTALISTTVFVAVFGLTMAFFLDKLMEVMSSTAAYAAVLVVFVGLSTSNTS